MKIGILIYPHVQPLDAIGPWEVFSIWQKILAPSVELVLVSECGGLVECDSSIVLQAHVDFSGCDNLDCLIVPGGIGRIEQIHNVRLIEFIQRQSKTCQILASVCTGAFLLAQAGVLKGQVVTSYWRSIKELTESFEVQIVEQRVVKSGKIWTAGGVTSGIDLALELINEVAGKDSMDKVRLLLEYFPTSAHNCQLDLANDLPNYGSNQISRTDLPKYITDSIGVSS